jgi:hypothetical protein
MRCVNVTADFSDFGFEKSIVKYDSSNTTNTYLGENGLIVLAQEKIQINEMTFEGPFHSLGHFLESPDKWCNKPYFGVKRQSPTNWPREGKATLIHIAILKAFGFQFSKAQMNDIYGTLAWYNGPQNELPGKSQIQALISLFNYEMSMWTKTKILSEWVRKNKLIKEMPKEQYKKLRWGMLGTQPA